MSKCNSESMKYSGMKLISRATPELHGGGKCGCNNYVGGDLEDLRGGIGVMFKF